MYAARSPRCVVDNRPEYPLMPVATPSRSVPVKDVFSEVSDLAKVSEPGFGERGMICVRIDASEWQLAQMNSFQTVSPAAGLPVV